MLLCHACSSCKKEKNGWHTCQIWEVCRKQSKWGKITFTVTEKYRSLSEFHSFVYLFCHKMLSLLAEEHMMYQSCIGKILCVLETDIQLFGKNKQHYICLKKTAHVIAKACEVAPGHPISGLLSVTRSWPAWDHWGENEFPGVSRNHFVVRMSVHHLLVCKSWVLQQDKNCMLLSVMARVFRTSFVLN